MENEQLEEAHYQSALQNILKAKTHTALWDKYTVSTLHSGLGIACAGLGDHRQEAVSEGEQAVELMRETKNAWMELRRRAHLARIYVMVDDPDSAIDMIKDLLRKPGQLSLPLLEIDPVWAPLRGHARYSEISGTSR
jgi:hypothetical protein